VDKSQTTFLAWRLLNRFLGQLSSHFPVGSFSLPHGFTKKIVQVLCLFLIALQPSCKPDSNNPPTQAAPDDGSAQTPPHDAPNPASPNDVPTNTITIKALIDGSDILKIQAHKIWYEHESWDLPGHWQGRDEPTLINNEPWHPKWNAGTSDEFENLQPSFEPRSPSSIVLIKLAGRGDAKITQWPSPDNNQTLGIHLNDEQYQGAAWYTVVIKWK
jgi:hypothetical protein